MTQQRVSAVLMVVACVANSLLVSHSLADAKSRETPLVKAIRRVRPSVVNIHSQKTVSTPNTVFPNMGPTQSRLSGMGTGIVVDPRGYFITNFHVVENVTQIRGTLVDGATYSARVLARDPETDLALLKIDPLNPLPVMPMGTSEDLMHGETVIAIGNAFGYEHTITRGIVSELHRNVKLSEKQSYRDLIQTDASINPGNSGGPLINADGELVGVNVAIRAGAQGIGFAIPAKHVKQVLAKMLDIRERNNTWHGITYRNIGLGTDQDSAVQVEGVFAGSPAEAAGLQSGDHIVAIDGTEIRFGYQIELAFIEKGTGESSNLTVNRGGETLNLALILESNPSGQGSPTNLVWNRLGLRLADDSATDVRVVSSKLRGGLEVTRISPGGPADKAGIAPGDVLVGLHQWEILSLDNVLYVLNRHSQDSSPMLRFLIIRGNEIRKGWLSIAE